MKPPQAPAGRARGLTLTASEKTVHEKGLDDVLKELHDELGTGALLAHLVALNAQRAAEEETGRICWLRPAYRNS